MENETTAASPWHMEKAVTARLCILGTIIELEERDVNTY